MFTGSHLRGPAQLEERVTVGRATDTSKAHSSIWKSSCLLCIQQNNWEGTCQREWGVMGSRSLSSLIFNLWVKTGTTLEDISLNRIVIFEKWASRSQWCKSAVSCYLAFHPYQSKWVLGIKTVKKWFVLDHSFLNNWTTAKLVTQIWFSCPLCWRLHSLKNVAQVQTQPAAFGQVSIPTLSSLCSIQILWNKNTVSHQK